MFLFTRRMCSAVAAVTEAATSPTVTPPRTTPRHVDALYLQRYVPHTTFVPIIPNLIQCIPQDVQEAIADEHGSLVAFMKRFPTDFELKYAPGGGVGGMGKGWMARSVPSAIARCSRQIGTLYHGDYAPVNTFGGDGGAVAVSSINRLRGRSAKLGRNRAPIIVRKRPSASSSLPAATPLWKHFGWQPSLSQDTEKLLIQRIVDTFLRDAEAAAERAAYIEHVNRLSAAAAGESSAGTSAGESLVDSAGSVTGSLRIMQDPHTGILWVSPTQRDGVALATSAGGCPLPSLDIHSASGKVVVHGYDALRLARLLSTEYPTSLPNLEQATRTYLSSSVLKVGLSLPDRFVAEYDTTLNMELLAQPILTSTSPSRFNSRGDDEGLLSVSGGDAEEHDFIPIALGKFQQKVLEAIRSAEAAAAAKLKEAEPTQEREEASAAIQKAKESPCVVPSVLVGQLSGFFYKMGAAIVRSEKYSKMSLAQLRDTLLENKARQKKAAVGEFKVSRLASIAERRAIRREFLIRQLPHGSPFFDPDVAALFIFDLLQDEKPCLPMQTLAEKVDRIGIPLLPFTHTFLCQFPDLFVVEEPTPLAIQVSRQGSHLPLSASSNSDNLRHTSCYFEGSASMLAREEVLMELALACIAVSARHCDPLRLREESLRLMLRRPVRKGISFHYEGGISQALGQFSDVFRVECVAFKPSSSSSSSAAGAPQSEETERKYYFHTTQEALKKWAKQCSDNVALLHKRRSEQLRLQSEE